MASPSPDLTAAIVQDPLVVSPEMTVNDAIALMANTQSQSGDIDTPIRCSCVVVVAEGQVVGLLTERDMVRLMAQHASLTQVQIKTVIDQPITPLRGSDLADVATVQQQLQQHQHPLPVVDADGGLLGILTDERWQAALAPRQGAPDQNSSVHSPQAAQSCTRLVMSAPVGIFRHDAHDNCIYVNDCYCQLTGLTPETAMGDQWQTHLHPDDRDRVVAAWGQFVQAQVAFNLEYRYQRADGTVKWVYSQSLVEQDNQGQVVGYIGTITDISDRKQSELALAQSESHQRALFSAIPDLLIHMDREGNYYRMAGGSDVHVVYPSEPHVRSVLPPTLVEQRLYHTQKALDTGELQRYEQVFEIEGEPYYEEVRVAPLTVDQVLIIIRDVTALKRAELALATSAAQNQAMLAAIPDLLFRVGEDGIYRGFVSPNRDLAIVPQETDLVGRFLHQVLPPDLAAQQLQAVQRAIHTGELQVYEQQVQVGVGGASPKETRRQDEEVRVIKNGPDEALLIVRDISERARLEAERKQAEAALIQSESRNRAILAALPDYLFCLGADGTYRDVVTHHPEITLFPAEFDPVGLKMADVLPAEVAHRQMCYLEAALRTGTLQTYEQQIQIRGQIRDEEVRVVKSGADEVLFMVRDISDRKRLETDRKQAEQQLQNLIEGTAATTGQDFFPALVSHIAQALQVSHALVTEQVGRELRTLGFWANGALQPTYLYGIAHTPCEQVLQLGQFHCPDSVQDRFPKDTDLVDLQAESYLGVVLLGRAGQVIGHLCILNQQGIQAPQRAAQILQVFAARAAAELERQRSTTALEQLNQALETKVAERTAALKEREQFLQTVLDTFPLAVFWKTQNSVYLGGNRNFLQDAGLDAVADLIGKTDNDLPWGQTEAAAFCSDDDQVLTSGIAKLGIVETQLQANGNQAWIETNKLPLHNLAGEVIGVLGTYQDITARKRAETALQNLIAGTAATTGQDFFPALVQHIAQTLEVVYAIVTEKVGPELKALAFWADGKLQPNFTYPSADTPCEQVMEIGELYYAGGVRDTFPEDSCLLTLAAESYLGVALYDSQGQAIGNLCILDHQPIPDSQRTKQILRVFAARAAAELERQRAGAALECLNQALETKVAERTAELQEREQFLQTVLDTFPLIVFWKDRDLVYRGGNRNFLKNAGLASLAELQGKTDYDLPWQTNETEAYQADDRQVIDTNTAKLGIIEPQHRADGVQIWSETNKLPLHNLEGEVIGILGTYQDITDRKAAEAAMRQQLAAIEAAIDGIGILHNGTYIYVNQAHLTLFGYEQPEALLGQSWQKLYAPEEAERFQREVFPLLGRDRAWQGEVTATRNDGSTFAQGISLTLTEDDLLICVCRDISEIKQAQAQITHNALHDPLTGLPNRTLLLERIDLAIHRTQRLQHHQYAVLFLDLDRFKVVNDSLGHTVGDQLLMAIAERLKVHLRSIDVVARLGGDEFVILLENINTTEEVVQIAERILADGRNPFILNGHEIFTSFSIGIVMGKAHYQQAADLIRDADIAMYRAKAKLHNSYKFFDADMHVQVLQRLTLETDLRRALEHQEFIPYYQPIFDLADSRLVGFEALIRWQHPSRGLIAPDQFITVAEETGLIVAIDRWMFHQACQQMVRWQGQFAHGFPLKISINLSAQDLRQPHFIQEIDHTLASTGLSGECIILEITERIVIADIDQTIKLLAQLETRKIQISIDDFGTGYSSLSYLHRLPVHSLKIDGSFVSQMQSDQRNYQVVSTIIALSRQLGLTTVAEGIETPQQLQTLQQLNCQLGQGYWFARPLPAHDIETRFFGGDRLSPI